MNPQDGQGGGDAAVNPPNDPLAGAANDSAAKFGYDDVGSCVVPCSSSSPVVLSQDKKHWVEIALVDQDGNPVPGENYSITVPGGSVITGSLNEKGRARVNGIDSGNCKITFPDLDQHAWEPR